MVFWQMCELIKLYELNPCLYAVGSVDYHNKLKKMSAYEEISQVSRTSCILVILLLLGFTALFYISGH